MMSENYCARNTTGHPNDINYRRVDIVNLKCEYIYNNIFMIFGAYALVWMSIRTRTHVYTFVFHFPFVNKL